MTTDRQAAISDIAAFVDDYVESYALDDGECYHEPTEHERLLIEDAINGLIADGKFEELMAAPITAERDALRAEVERLRDEAERYRWLLINATNIDIGPGYAVLYTMRGGWHSASLTAAIDAARAAQEGK